jgi:hypothetical protein
VSIYKAGHHQPPGGIDDLMLAVGREIGTDRSDPVGVNKNIGDRRMMDIAVMVVDPAAPDQQLFRACHVV